MIKRGILLEISPAESKLKILGKIIKIIMWIETYLVKRLENIDKIQIRAQVEWIKALRDTKLNKLT